MRRRSTYDAMQPVPQTTWLVEFNQYREPLRIEEVPPMADLRAVLVRAMYRSLEEGFVLGELADAPCYFCTKDGEQRQIVISRTHPGERCLGHSNVRYGPPLK